MCQKASLFSSKDGCELCQKSKKIQKPGKKVVKLKYQKLTLKMSQAFGQPDLAKDLNISTKTIDKYQSICSIGRSNSTVEKAYDLEDHIFVALKKHINLEAYECELRAYSHLDHPNIIKLLNYVTFTQPNPSTTVSEQNFIISLEYATKRDLCSYWKKGCPIKEDICQIIFKQILNGVHHMHEKEIAHMDLKLANIFLGERHVIKIGDFDHSCSTNKFIRSEHGTSGYQAPEMLQRMAHYGKPADIFALGIILFMLSLGCRPMIIENGIDDIFYRCIIDNNVDFFITTVSQKLKIDISPELKDILVLMLTWNPNKRPSSIELLNHSWLNSSLKDWDFYYHEMEKKLCFQNKYK